MFTKILMMSLMTLTFSLNANASEVQLTNLKVSLCKDNSQSLFYIEYNNGDTHNTTMPFKDLTGSINARGEVEIKSLGKITNLGTPTQMWKSASCSTYVISAVETHASAVFNLKAGMPFACLNGHGGGLPKPTLCRENNLQITFDNSITTSCVEKLQRNGDWEHAISLRSDCMK